jgi:hypothetical protein
VTRVRDFGPGPKPCYTDTQQSQWVNQPPHFDETYMGMAVGQIEQVFTNKRYERIA